MEDLGQYITLPNITEILPRPCFSVYNLMLHIFGNLFVFNVCHKHVGIIYKLQNPFQFYR
uniref:Uncharacterized protein n=1 Tax=Rhizophora mucronata TaxID=61149 RepID=A0A2P2PDK4_RHIMU